MIVCAATAALIPALAGGPWVVPVSVAESEILPPSMTPAEAVVVSVTTRVLTLDWSFPELVSTSVSPGATVAMLM